MTTATALTPSKVTRSGEIEVGGQHRGPPVLHDTAAASAAAKSQAMVQAHFLMAIKNPRDWNDVRDRLLTACKRTRFAEVARYSVPRAGGKVQGWTIRFAEEAMRDMRNLMPETTVTGEDDDKRILRVSVIDLEANIPLSMEVVIAKTIERKALKDGETPIRTRINSAGQTLYILPATEDDLTTKQAALVSKALRTMVLRLLPGDILEECLDEVARTNQAEDERDPNAAVKKIADNFSTLGVKPSDLKAHLGHEISSSSPAELQMLREIFAAIRSGEITWRDVMAESTPAAGADGGNPPASGVQGQGATLKERLKTKAKGKPETPTGQAQPAQGDPPHGEPAKT
jgi:hypothetical protein